MAIIAILAAIAIPNYFQYIARGNRSEARATLTQAAQWMERWRTERNSYQNPPNAPNPPALPAACCRSLAPSRNFQVQHHCRHAHAGPVHAVCDADHPGPMANDACGVLTLNQHRPADNRRRRHQSLLGPLTLQWASVASSPRERVASCPDR